MAVDEQGFDGHGEHVAFARCLDDCSVCSISHSRYRIAFITVKDERAGRQADPQYILFCALAQGLPNRVHHGRFAQWT
jgi:hypothetical protein